MLLTTLIVLSATGAVNPVKSGSSECYYPDEQWRTSTPEEQGMDSRILLDMFKQYGNQGRIIIIKNGYLVTNYDQSYLRKDMHHIHSCTKSIISLLIGIAHSERHIQTIDQPIMEYFPDYQLEDLAESKTRITLRHLLTMTGGMQWSDIPNIDSKAMSQTNDWIKYTLNRPMAAEPGQIWNYNSGGSHLLSVIIQRTTGLSAYEYAKEKIFTPLNINPGMWWADPQGYSTAGWGLTCPLLI